MSAVIETHQLKKIFEKPRGWRRISRMPPVTAVSDVSLSVEAGELFGLLGPNGAGKTTLVKILSTLIMPSSGTATIAGFPLSEASRIRARVGLVISDERSFYWRLSVRRNLDFFAAMYGFHGKEASERINAILTEVGLIEAADVRFSNLSSGMKQRAAIARSLLHQPQILFLDEPSRSLDPTATRRLHELLLTLMARQEMTIFLITHDLAEAEKLCQHVALMHRGRIQTIGRPSDLRQELRPQRHYTITAEKLDGSALQSLQQFDLDIKHESSIQQTQIHFQTTEEDGVLSAVIDCLRQHGLKIFNVEGAPPTLEEVFAHFTQHS